MIKLTNIFKRVFRLSDKYDINHVIDDIVDLGSPFSDEELKFTMKRLIDSTDMKTVLELNRTDCSDTYLLSAFFDEVISVGTGVHDHMYQVKSGNIVYLTGDMEDPYLQRDVLEYGPFSCVWIGTKNIPSIPMEYLKMVRENNLIVIANIKDNIDTQLRNELKIAYSDSYQEIIKSTGILSFKENINHD